MPRDTQPSIVARRTDREEYRGFIIVDRAEIERNLNAVDRVSQHISPDISPKGIPPLISYPVRMQALAVITVTTQAST